MKRLRFTSLVQAAGRPHAATLWTSDPAKDPEFGPAIEENRVLTIHTTNVGTKKDKAHIGFAKGKPATYLIFPKPLPMQAGTPVIGIKFDLLEDEEVKDPVKVKAAKRKTKVEKVKTAADEKQKEAEPEEAVFLVSVKSTATVTRELKVKAANASAALAAAEKEAAKVKAPKKLDWQHEALEARKK